MGEAVTIIKGILIGIPIGVLVTCLTLALCRSASYNWDIDDDVETTYMDDNEIEKDVK